MKERVRRLGGRWQMRNAMDKGDAKVHTIMVLLLLGERGHEGPTGRGLPFCRPLSRPSCHGHRPASQAEDREAGWLEEYIGYMQDHGMYLD